MHLRSGRSLAAIFLAAALTLHAAAATEDPSAQWEQKVQAAERLLATGRPAQAESLLREALEIARSSEPTSGRPEDTLGLLAVSLLQQDKLGEAEEVFEELLVLREASEGLEDRALFADRRELARAFRLAGKPEIAEGFFRRALERTAARLGPGHPMVAALWIDLGNFLQELGRYEEAEQAQRQALRLREEYFGPDHPRVADSYYNLGIALAARDKFAEAEEAYRHALAIEEKLLGLDDPALGRIVNNLAGVLDDLGRHQEALTLRRRTLQLWEAAYGPNAPLIGMALTNLARTLRFLDNDEEAEKPLRRALWTFEKAFGTDALELASPMTSLAAVLIGKPKQLAEAEALVERALRIQEQHLALAGPLRVAESLRVLAGVRQLQRRPGDAEALRLQVLQLYEQADGPESYSAGLGAWGLAEHHFGNGMEGMAAPMYERALRLLEKTRGPDHPLLAKLWNSAATFYSNQGRFEEAEKLYRRAIAQAERQLGADHPLRKTLLSNYASMLRSANRLEEANHIIDGFAAAAAERAATAETAEERWRGAMEAAGLATFRGRYQEAEAAYAQALQEAESFDRLDPRRVQTLREAANNLLHQQKQKEAEPLLRQALALEKEVGGEPERDEIAELRALGDQYDLENRIQDATQVFERSLELQEGAQGPLDERLAQTLATLGNLYRRAGKFRESEAYFRRALALLRDVLGREDLMRSPLEGLGALYMEEGRYGEAEAVYREDVERSEKQWGPDHPALAGALSSLASCLRKAGRTEEAAAIESRRDSLLPKPHAPTAAGGVAELRKLSDSPRELNVAALALGKEGRYEEALELITRGIQLAEEQTGAESELSQALLENYASLLRRAGRQAEANAIEGRRLKRLEALAEAATTPEESWQAYVDAAGLAAFIGNVNEAERLFEEAVKAAERLGPQDVRLLQTMLRLSNLQLSHEQTASAEKSLRRALSVTEKSPASNSQEMVRVLKSLALTAEALGRPDVAAAFRARAEQGPTKSQGQ